MKKIISVSILLFLSACQEPLKEGYCVGKTYTPTHWEDVSHSRYVGKVWHSYTVREKKQAVFTVYISKMDRVREINVDSINYPKFKESKYYMLNK